jgi:thiamine biosynthesis lipoprotein
MGTELTISVSGHPDLLELGVARVDQLEQLWSRFLPDSDISRCNETRGLQVFVHADTRRLVRHGLRANALTAGTFDPTVLDALVAAGYDRTFEEIAPSPERGHEPTAAPGCTGIEIDDDLGSVTLPLGTGFDPGAIGKGLAADLVATELIDAGATEAFVCIGGDIRTAGSPADADGWAVDIHGAGASDVVATVALPAVGLATSTDARRRWLVGGEDRHHVIDPRTGRPADGAATLVTTIAGEAWWAEALATQLMLTPRHGWAEAVADDGALIIDNRGRTNVIGCMEAYLR